MASVVAVVFDVGETLIDETEAWGGWADWLDVPRLTLFATLGAVIARGGHHSDALRMVRPGIDVDAETRARDAAGHGFRMTADDLYPDAMPCLRALAAAGIVIGIAGNQPASTETLLRAMDVPLALVASSQTWGVEKPDPAFFARICAGTPALRRRGRLRRRSTRQRCGRRCCGRHESRVPPSRPVGDHPVGAAGPVGGGRRGDHPFARGLARSARGDRRRCSVTGRALCARTHPETNTTSPQRYGRDIATTHRGCVRSGGRGARRRSTSSRSRRRSDTSGKARPCDAATDSRQPRVEGSRVRSSRAVRRRPVDVVWPGGLGVRARTVVVDHQSRATSGGRRPARSCLSQPVARQRQVTTR